MPSTAPPRTTQPKAARDLSPPPLRLPFAPVLLFADGLQAGAWNLPPTQSTHEDDPTFPQLVDLEPEDKDDITDAQLRESVRTDPAAKAAKPRFKPSSILSKPSAPEQFSFPSMGRNDEVSRQRAADQIKISMHTAYDLTPIFSLNKTDTPLFNKIDIHELEETDFNDEMGEAERHLKLLDESASGGCTLGTLYRQQRFANLDELINKSLDWAVADRKRGRESTGVRAFHGFCADIGISPHRPLDPATTPLRLKLEEEWTCMRFLAALVEDRGIQPRTAATYFSATQGWHAREHGVKLCAGLKLERLPQMLKGLRRIVGEEPRAIRRGIAPQMLKKAMDLCLDPAIPEHANIRAALAVALQGLLRSKEYCGFDDPRFILMRSDLVEFGTESMTIMMHPCKNMRHIGGKTCPLLIGAGGQYVDAVAEVRNLLEVDPVPDALKASTPLFRVPSTNKPLSYELVLGTTKQLMQAIGENPEHFGTHSYRIGGATALFAAGANETIIRTMGRWSSDLHRLYVRACREQCLRWTQRAGSTQVSDVAGTFEEVDYY